MKKSKKLKQRTHKAAAKRFKITATGKVLHRAHGARHRISYKSKSQVRRLRRMKLVTGAFEKKLKKLLGLA
jgi:large subunit ribosomal protein L35